MSEVRGRAEIEVALERAASTQSNVRFLYRASGQSRAEWRSRRITGYAPPYFFAATSRRRGIRYRLDRVQAVDAAFVAWQPAPTPALAQPRPSRSGKSSSDGGWGWVAVMLVVAAVLWWPDEDTPPSPSTVSSAYTSSSSSVSSYTPPPRATAAPRSSVHIARPTVQPHPRRLARSRYRPAHPGIAIARTSPPESSWSWCSPPRVVTHTVSTQTMTACLARTEWAYRRSRAAAPRHRVSSFRIKGMGAGPRSVGMARTRAPQVAEPVPTMGAWPGE